MNTRLEKLKQMEQQQPADAFIKFAIAQEYVGINDDEHAKVYFETIRQNWPNYVPLYYQLGNLYERLNDTKLATEVYTQGITAAKAANDLKTAGELNTALMLIEE